jgi:hypothetical protein
MVITGFLYNTFEHADPGGYIANHPTSITNDQLLLLRLFIGDLTLLRQKLVCNRSLGLASLRLGLHHFLLHSSTAVASNINLFIATVNVCTTLLFP